MIVIMIDSLQMSTEQRVEVIQASPSAASPSYNLHAGEQGAEEEEDNIPRLLKLDNPRQLMGQLHIKTVKLQQARNELDKLKSENNIINDQLKKMKFGLLQINNKCQFLNQPPLRYKYDPRL